MLHLNIKRTIAELNTEWYRAYLNEYSLNLIYHNIHYHLICCLNALSDHQAQENWLKIMNWNCDVITLLSKFQCIDYEMTDTFILEMLWWFLEMILLHLILNAIHSLYICDTFNFIQIFWFVYGQCHSDAQFQITTNKNWKFK